MIRLGGLPRRDLWRRACAAVPILTLAACTYLHDRDDLTSGRKATAVANAEMANANAAQTNAALQLQQRAIHLQIDDLDRRVAEDQAQLASIDTRLHDATRATTAQRTQAALLKQQYVALKKQIDSTAQPAADFAAQQRALADLQKRKEDLEQQVKLLEGALR